MSPQLAAEERLRRLAPLAAGLVAAAFALVPRLPAPPTELQGACAALIACAAALLAHAVAAARGVPGIAAGAAAGCWLAAVATTMTRASEHVPTAAALALAATGAALLGRAASRERPGEPPYLVAAPAATALAILEPRAWALAGAVAALIALRERTRARRYLAIAPALAALGAGIVTLLVVLGDAPAWARSAVLGDVAAGGSSIGPAAWLELAVDGLGPIALVLATIGALALASERRGRWFAVATAAALAAFAPLTATPPVTALVGLALAMGAALAAAAARVGRPRHQVLTAGALAALMLLPFAL